MFCVEIASRIKKLLDFQNGMRAVTLNSEFILCGLSTAKSEFQLEKAPSIRTKKIASGSKGAKLGRRLMVAIGVVLYLLS